MKKRMSFYDKIISRISKSVKYSINESLFDDEYVDSLSDETDNVISKHIDEDIKKDIVYKINNNHILTGEEKQYLKTAKNVFVPNNKFELRKILRKLFSQNITDFNCINVSKVDEMIDLFYHINTAYGFELVVKDEIYINIDEWDVSNVMNMSQMFLCCEDLNFDIGKWDVSNVKYMTKMFRYCKKFNCDLSKWDVSNVKKMGMMFSHCNNFNSDLSNWNISPDTNCFAMFNSCGINRDFLPKIKL